MRRKGYFVAAGMVVCLMMAAGAGAAGAEKKTAAAVAPEAPTADATNAVTSSAQPLVPQLIKFSGALQDLAGKPIAGPVDAAFSLYAQPSGGTPLWYESQTVNADAEGRYTVLLGAMTQAGVPMDLFTSGEARWLGVMVNGLPEQPRVLLVSVPYAMSSGNSEMLGGKPAADYLLAGSGSPALVTATGTSGNRAPKSDTTAPINAPGSTPVTTAGGTVGYVPMWDSTSDITNSGIFQLNGNVGIGTTTPGSPLTVNGSADFSSSSTAAAGDVLAFKSSQALTVPKTSGWFYANYFQAAYTGSSANTGNLIGMTMNAQNNGAGTLPSAIALFAQNAIGSAASGGITNSYDLFLAAPSIVGSGTITNQYGVVIQPMTTTGVTSGYGIWQEGASDTNYLAGNLGIGTATPAHTLDVAGDINASGHFIGDGSQLTNVSTSGLAAGTYANAYSFTNAGNSFTGNGAGLTSLTGANVTGSVPSATSAATATNALALNGVAASGYALLGSANTFTADQTFNTDINLPQTASATVGVINLGGSPFIHAYGTANTFIGQQAGNFSTSGYANSASGYEALALNTSGYANTASGLDAMYNNTTGYENTASGASALLANTTGNNNTASGFRALIDNTTGNNNTASGVLALIGNTMGSDNTASGFEAGQTNTTGELNTFLGYRAEASSGTLSNATAMGANAVVGESNAIVLGCSGTGCASGTTPPDVGIGTTTPAHTLDVAGDINTSGHFIGDGSQLTNVSTSGLAAGTYANAYSFTNAGNSFTGNGAGLTNVNAATLNGLASSSFARLGSNAFSGNETITGNLGVSGSTATNELLGQGSTQAANDTLYLGTGGMGNFFLDREASGGQIILGYNTPKGSTSFGPLQVYNNQSDHTLLFEVQSAGTSGSNAVLMPHSNVGIGTTTPAATLDVEGPPAPATVGSGTGTPGLAGLSLSAQNGGATNGSSGTGGAGGSITLTSGSGGNDSSGVSGATGAQIQVTGGLGALPCPSCTNPVQGGSINLLPGTWFSAPTGTVNIGTTTSATLLTVHGDVTVGIGGSGDLGCVEQLGGSAIAGTCSSDERLKKGIQPFAPLLDDLAQLRPVHFYWRAKQFPQYHFGSQRNEGLIAQQVEKVFPNMVTTDARGYKMVNYSQLPCLLLEGVRELKTRNDNLTFEVQAQRRQIGEARAEMASLRQAATVQDGKIAQLARASAAKDAQVAALAAQNRKLAGEVAQLQKAQGAVEALEARLARDEAQARRTSLKLARVMRNPKQESPAELARVQF